jgi:long-chain acyl-CoA synthetase
LFVRLRVSGLRHLEGVAGPVILASNHQSYLDTPAILAALPGRWRYRVCPAMRREFFDAHFHPAGHGRVERLRNSLGYYLAALMFHAFPLAQREAGTKQSLRYAGELVAEGWSILLFPEGRHAEDDGVGSFQPGIGMMAARLGVPVVPVRLKGVNRVLHPTWRMARPGRVEVAFGAPMRFEGPLSYAEIAERVELAVKSL